MGPHVVVTWRLYWGCGIAYASNMVRDRHQGLDARRAHQAFQAIKPVERKLVASVGPTTIKSSTEKLWAEDECSMRPKAMSHPAAPAINSAR